MNKKILTIGSIIACAILLVAGLSPVVGYQSVKNNPDNVITDELVLIIVRNICLIPLLRLLIIQRQRN